MVTQQVQKLHNKSDDPAVEKQLEDILQKLYGFYAQKIDMSLERVERFLNQIDDPHLNLPPVVHIAGTNGKGSTIAVLRSLLEQAGLRVHVMTSPHLVHPTERIRIAGELISSKYLIELLEECLNVNRSEPITFFEMFTAATFLAFARNDADICLLETGMGGRLDATNVVPNPIATIITTISKDHENFLGGSLDKIAFEKAGIMKAGAPCVIGYQTKNALNAGVMNVFEKKSKSLKAPSALHRFGHEWHSRQQGSGIIFEYDDQTMQLKKPNLIGMHQIYNASAALMAFDLIQGILGLKSMPLDKVNKALQSIHWPGRLQKITSGKIMKNFSPQDELWLDGGHNDSAGAFLANQAREWQNDNPKDLHLIIAMVDRKTPSEFLAPLLPYTKSITFTEISGEETSFEKEKLKAIAIEIGFKEIYLADDINEAMQNIKGISAAPARILATGSLYFLGNILNNLT